MRTDIQLLIIRTKTTIMQINDFGLYLDVLKVLCKI